MEILYYLLKNENEKNIQDTLKKIYSDYENLLIPNLKEISFEKSFFEKLHVISLSFSNQEPKFFKFRSFHFMEHMDSPFYFTLPFKIGKFLGLKMKKDKIQKFENKEFRYEYILENIKIVLPGGNIENVEIHWIVEESHHFIFNIPTCNLFKFSKEKRYQMNMCISKEELKYLITPVKFEKIGNSISRNLIPTETMEEKRIETYFNIYGKETIINTYINLKYETEYYLGPLPPLSISLNTSHSYEWMLSSAKEMLILEKEDKFKDFPTLMPKRKDQDKIFQYVFMNEFPIILSGSKDIVLDEPLLCIKGDYVNKKLYIGLMNDSVLLGINSLKNEDLIITFDDLPKIQYLSKRECLIFIKEISLITLDCIKSNNFYYDQYGWLLKNHENKMGLNEDVFWILEDIELIIDSISEVIPIILKNIDVSIIPKSFMSLHNSNRLNLRFHNVDVELSVELNNYSPLIPIISFKEFLNSFKIYHIHQFDLEFQEMIDKNEFLSLEEARKNYFQPNMIKLNEKFQYSWPIYNFSSSSAKIIIGDFHEKLIKEKPTILEIKNKKYTNISIVKGFIIKIED